MPRQTPYFADGLIILFNNVKGYVTLKLVNMAGKAILIEKATIANGQHITLPVGNLAAGMYFITAKYNGVTLMQKVLKQ